MSKKLEQGMDIMRQVNGKLADQMMQRVGAISPDFAAILA